MLDAAPLRSVVVVCSDHGSGLLGETEKREPKHVERDTMIGLRSDRRVDRETIDKRDDDVRQQLNRHSRTKLQKRKESVHRNHCRFTPRLRRSSDRIADKRAALLGKLVEHAKVTTIDFAGDPHPEIVYRSLRRAARQCCRFAIHRLMRHPLNEPRQECFFVVEMIVNQSLAHARSISDVLHAQVRCSAGDDPCRGGVKDPLRR